MKQFLAAISFIALVVLTIGASPAAAASDPVLASVSFYSGVNKTGTIIKGKTTWHALGGQFSEALPSTVVDPSAQTISFAKSLAAPTSVTFGGLTLTEPVVKDSSGNILPPTLTYSRVQSYLKNKSNVIFNKNAARYIDITSYKDQWVTQVIMASNFDGMSALGFANNIDDYTVLRFRVEEKNIPPAEYAPVAFKNLSVAEATSSSTASGVLGAKNVIIGSFIIKLDCGGEVQYAACQSGNVTVNQINIKDDSADGAFAAVFKNFRVQHLNADLAPAVGVLSPVGGTIYTVAFTEPVTIAPGEQFVVDLVADVQAAPGDSARNSINTDVNGIVYPTNVNFITASGGSGTVVKSAPFLQRVFIAKHGSLLVSLLPEDGPMPTKQQIMGTIDKKVLTIAFTAADSAEDVIINELVITDIITAPVDARGALINFRLYDGINKVGYMQASFDSTGAGIDTGYVKFSNFNFVIPKGQGKALTLVVDFNAWPLFYSGSKHVLAVKGNYDGTGELAIKMKGATSGAAFTPIFPGGADALYGDPITIALTRVSVVYAADAPSGAAAAGMGSVVGKFVVSNTANVNGKMATVKLMNVNVSTSISQAGGLNTPRWLKFYKSYFDSQSQLALVAFNTASGMPPLGDTNFTDATFTDFDIDSGLSVAVFVTLDTNDAKAMNTLTVGMGGDDITWSDSYTTFGETTGLPLVGKTLTY